MTLYHDSEYKEKDADMECAVPITGRCSISDPSVRIRTLAGGKCLTLIYKGPYAGFHEAWSRIGAYAEEQEFSIAGPHRELYLNDPSVVEESELLTELQIPLDPVLPG
jgi:effector-binding domain-containing protein